MFNIIVIRPEREAVVSVSVDGVVYSPKEDIRVRAGLLKIRYTSDQGKMMLSILSSADRMVYMTCPTTFLHVPVGELLIEPNRMLEVQPWGQIG